MFSLLCKFLIDFLVRNKSSKKISFNSSLDHYLHFSFILGLVSVGADSGGPRLEHCRFWLISRSILEEFERVVHFLTHPGGLMGMHPLACAQLMRQYHFSF